MKVWLLLFLNLSIGFQAQSHELGVPQNSVVAPSGQMEASSCQQAYNQLMDMHSRCLRDCAQRDQCSRPSLEGSGRGMTEGQACDNMMRNGLAQLCGRCGGSQGILGEICRTPSPPVNPHNPTVGQTPAGQPPSSCYTICVQAGKCRVTVPIPVISNDFQCSNCVLDCWNGIMPRRN